MINRDCRRSWVAPSASGTLALHTIRLACLTAGCALLVGAGRAQDTVESQQPTTHSRPGHLKVEVADRTVSVTAREATVGQLLAEIARQSGLAVDSEGPLDERADLELDRVPLREALHRILRGHNFVLLYVEPPSGVERASDALPNRLWVFSKRPDDPHAPSKSGAAGREASEADERLLRLSLALADANAKVRLAAVTEMLDIGSDEAEAALAAAALLDPESSVREEAVYGLGEIGGEAGVAILEQALMDPERSVREAAVEAFTAIGGEDSAGALAVALNDEDASLREQAVYALGEVGGETAISLVHQALADEQDSVRDAAAEVLDELSSDDQ